jgi:hypothetical protein
MMPDAIYYLASTIAQTIGSLAGFLGAFVLFHIQGRLRNAEAYARVIRSRGYSNVVNGATEDGDPEAIESALQAYLFANPGGPHVAINQHIDEYWRRYDAIYADVPRFKVAMFWTAPVLIASLVMIPLAHRISDCAPATIGYGLSAALIVGFTWCGWRYWLVVSAALRKPKIRQKP